ncbi:MAG: putative transport system permease protein, partial [Acidimicrobiaceae bacterium]
PTRPPTSAPCAASTRSEGGGATTTALTRDTTLPPIAALTYGHRVGVVAALAQANARRRLGGLLGIALVLAVGLGVSVSALEAATRTEHAYPDYLRRANVGEVVVNPSLATDRAAEIIASTPGVLGFTSDSLLTAAPATDQPTSDEDQSLQVRVSNDGRYTSQDLPVVHSGRMIGDGREAFVNEAVAQRLHIHVGDEIPLAFFAPTFSDPTSGDLAAPPPVVSLGQTTVRVVGIGVFSDEVLVDELYPRERILVTPEVGAPYDCVQHAPPADDPRSLDELVNIFESPTCSMSYRYYSLRIAGGDAGVKAVTDALNQQFADENQLLPVAFQQADITYGVIPTTTADQRTRLHQSLAPAVTALRLFSLAAAVATLVVALLAAVRVVRRRDDEVQIWRQLGATRPQRLGGLALPFAPVVLVGLAGALAVGWASSGLGPVASAREVDPHSHLGVGIDVAAVVLGGSAVVLAVAVLLVTGATSRVRVAAAPRRPSSISRLVNRVPGVAPLLGIRAALRSAGATAMLLASIAAVTAVLATVVFTTSLNALVATPAQYGWPYDLGVMTNFGYGLSDRAAITTTLDRPEVQRWAIAGVSGGFAVGGVPVPTVSDRGGFTDLPVQLVRGRIPAADDELALGSLTADRLGVDVGDHAQVTSYYGERDGVVTGIVVLPPVGPFEADQASLGTGALLSSPFLEAMVAPGEAEGGLAPKELADSISSFVVIDLVDGTDKESFLASIRPDLQSWDLSGAPPFVYDQPVQPALIADAAAMRGVPVALGSFFALAMAGGLILGIAVATRARRRELALLRAVGCTGRQLRATVRWHALTIVGVGLAVGVPLGIALGRTAYRVFAEGIGAKALPVLSPGWITLVAATTIVAGLVAGLLPGRRAAHEPAAVTLRSD